MITKQSNSKDKKIPIYFFINGIFATIIHYILFDIFLNVIQLGSAGFSTLIASVFASLFSFFGNKYFVFRVEYGSVAMQATRFSVLYSIVALFHGGVLLIWTDWLDYNYIVGFLLALTFQAVVSYCGNKNYVFKK